MTVSLSERPTWSKSQISALNECERKVGFHAFASQFDDLNSRKKLINRHLWTGQIVHDAVGDILKRVRQGEAPAAEADVLAAVREKMRTQFRASTQGSPSFFEHYYNVEVSNVEWRRSWESVEKSIHWFLTSKWLKRLTGIGPEAWKAVDEILDFDINGVKTYVKIDCAIEAGGRFFLIDWKTAVSASTSEPSLQVAALYAHDVWGADPEAIDAMAVSLISGQSFHAHITEESLMETQMRIDEEAQRIQAVLETVTDHPKTLPPASDQKVCHRCNFNDLCYPNGRNRNEARAHAI